MPFQFSSEEKDVIEEGTKSLDTSIVTKNSHDLFNMTMLLVQYPYKYHSLVHGKCIADMKRRTLT